VDLLYIDNVSQAFWVDAIPHRRSLLRIADRNMGLGRPPAAVGRIEHELARSVDLVVYAAESLEGYVREMRPKRMRHLPNGVDFERFARGAREAPPEYRSIPRPIAVYVGAMDVWFDYGLLNAAAERLPHVSFVLIGPESLARRRLAPRANVHLLGRRAHDVLPPYLHHADVGLIPFDVAGHPDLVHGVNPLKLYEYLACGLPVVSVAWDELRRLESPAILADTAERFIQGIAEALAKRPAADDLVRYAARRDWSSRVEAICRYLDEAS
jgi:glycosyltransferase involved in cell wall biosynthesis